MPADRSHDYGRPPLPQLARLAASTRELVDRALRLTGSQQALERAIESLDATSLALEPLLASDPGPRVGPDARKEQRYYFDRSQFVGAFIAGFPLYSMGPVEGCRAHGHVRFDLSHEGAPGCVFGGSLALFFDMIFQHHGAELGASGSTVSQEVRYLSPVPLLTEVAFEVWEESLDGRKRHMGVRLSLAGEALAECSSLQILPRRGSPDRNPTL